ncbi:MAG: acyl-CoA thioesterase [Microbacteriaceae bacterium]|nr:acyl-CoA thioesterase [Microbacteriaceae bacterium]
MLSLWIRRRRFPKLSYQEVSRVNFRVLPTDLDVLGHMNNGRFLTLMDLGRVAMMSQTGMWKRLRELDWYPVVVQQTITYRKSLNPWVKYQLETKFHGIDEKSVYLEQRFVVDGEIYAKAFIRARFLSKKTGTLRTKELMEGLNYPDAPTVPKYISDWAKDFALPPTKAEAPSVWE